MLTRLWICPRPSRTFARYSVRVWIVFAKYTSDRLSGFFELPASSGNILLCAGSKQDRLLRSTPLQTRAKLQLKSSNDKVPSKLTLPEKEPVAVVTASRRCWLKNFISFQNVRKARKNLKFYCSQRQARAKMRITPPALRAGHRLCALCIANSEQLGSLGDMTIFAVRCEKLCRSRGQACQNLLYDYCCMIRHVLQVPMVHLLPSWSQPNVTHLRKTASSNVIVSGDVLQDDQIECRLLLSVDRTGVGIGRGSEAEHAERFLHLQSPTRHQASGHQLISQPSIIHASHSA